MSENSAIQWTHHTFNPWWGCAKVSPGCDNCYAERDAGRYQPDKVLWGIDAERREFGDKHWGEPMKWQKKAHIAGEKQRVFCASMADVFDKNAPRWARERLWAVIEQTPNLDWLLLTKRIGNVKHMMPPNWLDDDMPPNVWLGISVVNQEEANRDIPKLLAVNVRVRFLSCEPLLEPLLLDAYLPELQWAIVGGESGHKARPFDAHWAASIVGQCQIYEVPCFVKQLGAHVIQNGERRIKRDKKGADMDEWPHEIRVREFPA